MKIKIDDFFEYIFALFLILDGFSIYMTPQNNRVLFTALSLVVLVLLNLVKNGNVRNKSFVPLLLSICALIYFVQDIKDVVLGSVLFVFGLPLFIRYLCKCNIKGHPFSILNKIDDLICLLTICSLILWILGPIGGILKPNMSFAGSWGAWTYKESYVPGYFGLLFLTQIEDGTFLTNEIWRNTSIFAEGPMYNLWLCIGFTITLFLKKSASRWRICVYILGVMSTFSSTGFIFLSIIGGYYVMKTGALVKLHKNRFLKYIVILLTFVFSYFLVREVLVQKSDSVSYMIRMNEYTNAFNSFRLHPIFGVGYKNGSEYDFGMSNSLMSVLGCGGLYMFLLIYFPIGYVLSKIKAANFRLLGITFAYIILTLSTNFYTQFIFIIFPAILYSILINKKSWIK